MFESVSSLRRATSLIKMYGKCGSLQRARETFDGIRDKDLVCWTAMITAYAHNGHGREALHLFENLQTQGLTPDAFTFSGVLDACASIKELPQGKLVHAQLRRSGLESNPVVANALMNMYAKCGCLRYARRILDGMPERNAVSWNTMICAYAREGNPEEALQLYRDMDVEPTAATFVTALVACGSLRSFCKGKLIHDRVQEMARLEENPLVVSAIIDMYATCDRLVEARKVFETKRLGSVHVWSSMISAYCRQGRAKTGLKLYKEMVAEGIKPDAVTFVIALNACSSLKLLEEGQGIHKLVPLKVQEENVYIGNSLVNLYGKCGCIDEAQRVFGAMKCKDIVSWNSIISSCAQQGNGTAAIQLFQRMVTETKLEPNEITFHAVIDACSDTRNFQLGRQVHAAIRDRGMLTDWLAASLVEMYSRCGSLIEAEKLITDKDLPSSWTAVLAAYAHNGETFKVLQLYYEMELAGVNVDAVTYVSLLSACSHGGLIQPGCCFFRLMTDDRGVAPLLEHFACIVDLLSRAGWLHEAERFIKQLPVEPDAETYMALLGACRTQRNFNLGSQVAERVLSLDPVHRGAYSLLYNLYAERSQSDEPVKYFYSSA